MNTLFFEIIPTLAARDNIDNIVSSSVEGIESFIQTRIYNIDYTDDSESVTVIFKKIYFDSDIEKINPGGNPFFTDADAVIDVTLRKGVLDLEYEYTKKYFSLLAENNQTNISEIKSGLRYYLFGSGNPDIDNFIKFGPVNPAIHKWEEIK